MWAALAPALVQGGLSIMSGIMGGNSAAKQARLQKIENERVEYMNRMAIEHANAQNAKLARKVRMTPHKMWTTEHVTASGTNDVDIDGMMAAAEKSGINPITFIRNGGLAAYSRSLNKTSTESYMKETGHNALGAAQLASPTVFQAGAQQIPVQKSAGESIVGGISDGFRTFMDGINRQNTQDFQRELLNTQLTALQSGKPVSRTFSTPGFSTSGSTIISPKTQGGLSVINPQTPSVGDTTATNPWTNFKVEGKNADTQFAEDRYGEVAGELFGLSNFVDDVMLNLTGLTKDQRYAKTKNMWDKFIGGLSKSKTDPAPKYTDPMGGVW